MELKKWIYNIKTKKKKSSFILNKKNDKPFTQTNQINRLQCSHL